MAHGGRCDGELQLFYGFIFIFDNRELANVLWCWRNNWPPVAVIFRRFIALVYSFACAHTHTQHIVTQAHRKGGNNIAAASVSRLHCAAELGAYVHSRAFASVSAGKRCGRPHQVMKSIDRMAHWFTLAPSPNGGNGGPAVAFDFN